MAKLFSNIAKKQNLSQIYSDSTVNGQFTTFSSLRTNVSNTLGVPSSLVNVRRITDVYNLYAQVPANLNPITLSYSALTTPVVLKRDRISEFYKGFKIVNNNLTITNLPINGTLVEIQPPTDRTQVNDSEIYPVDRSRILQNSQALPLVSGPRDVYRIGQYLTSGEGIRFLAFQRQLQTGNTFRQSRKYDVTSVPGMALNYSAANLNNPLERIPRMALVDTMINPELWGRIQRDTVIDAQSKLRLKFVGGARRAVPSQAYQATTRTLAGYAGNRIANSSVAVPGIARRFTSWLNNTFDTRFSIGNTVTLGQIGNALNNIATIGDTISRSLNIDNATLEKDQTAYDALYRNDLWPLMKDNDGVVRSHAGEKAAYIARARAALGSIKGQINNVNTFTQQYPQDDYRSSATYTEDVRNPQSARIQTIDGVTIVNARYVKDNLNLDTQGNAYADISNLDGLNINEDYIKFGIKVPGVFPNGIFFRAFLEDINHNARGEYETIRYVGRPERFVTYRGMSRNITLSLLLIAFSENELDTIWARCNMLNKLVYPIDNDGGFMTPPLIQMTLGNVLNDQPGYVENISMRLTDIPWDIDRELPQAVKINMEYNIIEKGYINQKETNSLRYIQLFNQSNANNLLGPPPPPLAPLDFNINSTFSGLPTYTPSQQIATTTTQPTPQAQQPRRAPVPNAPADATRVALPQRTTTPSYLTEAQQAFGLSAAATNLQSAFNNLRRPNQARPTIGPRP